MFKSDAVAPKAAVAVGGGGGVPVPNNEAVAGSENPALTDPLELIDDARVPAREPVPLPLPLSAPLLLGEDVPHVDPLPPLKSVVLPAIDLLCVLEGDCAIKLLVAAEDAPVPTAPLNDAPALALPIDPLGLTEAAAVRELRKVNSPETLELPQGDGDNLPHPPDPLAVELPPSADDPVAAAPLGQAMVLLVALGGPLLRVGDAPAFADTVPFAAVPVPTPRDMLELPVAASPVGLLQAVVEGLPEAELSRDVENKVDRVIPPPGLPVALGPPLELLAAVPQEVAEARAGEALALRVEVAEGEAQAVPDGPPSPLLAVCSALKLCIAVPLTAPPLADGAPPVPVAAAALSVKVKVGCAVAVPQPLELAQAKLPTAVREAQSLAEGDPVSVTEAAPCVAEGGGDNVPPTESVPIRADSLAEPLPVAAPVLLLEALEEPVSPAEKDPAIRDALAQPVPPPLCEALELAEPALQGVATALREAAAGREPLCRALTVIEGLDPMLRETKGENEELEQGRLLRLPLPQAVGEVAAEAVGMTLPLPLKVGLTEGQELAVDGADARPVLLTQAVRLSVTLMLPELLPPPCIVKVPLREPLPEAEAQPLPVRLTAPALTVGCAVPFKDELPVPLLLPLAGAETQPDTETLPVVEADAETRAGVPVGAMRLSVPLTVPEGQPVPPADSVRKNEPVASATLWQAEGVVEREGEGETDPSRDPVALEEPQCVGASGLPVAHPLEAPLRLAPNPLRLPSELAVWGGADTVAAVAETRTVPEAQPVAPSLALLTLLPLRDGDPEAVWQGSAADSDAAASVRVAKTVPLPRPPLAEQLPESVAGIEGLPLLLPPPCVALAPPLSLKALLEEAVGTALREGLRDA